MSRATRICAAALALFACHAPAMAQEPADAAGLYQEGVAAYRAGKPAAAAERLRRVLALTPDHADARLQLGLALLALRRYDEAKHAFETVLAKAPAYNDARLGLARVAFFRGQLDVAAHQLDAIRARAPGHAEAATLVAQIDRARRSRVASRAEPPGQDAKAGTRHPARVEAQSERLAAQGRSLRRQGRFAQAEQVFRDALASRPHDADLWVDLGLAEAFQSRFEDARQAFERALALSADHLDAVLGLARIDLYTGALDQAADRVAHVLAARPNDRDAQALAARIRLAQGDAEGAERAFRSLSAEHPGELDYQVGLGDALRALERDDEARDAFLAAQRIDSSSLDVQNRLALTPRPRWRFDLDGAYSRLSGGLDPWRQGRASLAYRLDSRTSLAGTIDANQRFGETDVTFEGSIEHRWSAQLSHTFRFGGTPDAHFRPTVFAAGGGSLRLAPGSGPLGLTLATLDLAWARYPTGDVKTASPGLQQYLFGGRVWLTGRLIGTISEADERLGGYLVQADWLVADRLGIFVGYSDAPDPSNGRTIETRVLFGGLHVDLSDALTLRVSASREERKQSYDRTTVNLGVTTRF